MKKLKVVLLFFLFTPVSMSKSSFQQISGQNFAEYVRAYASNDYSYDWVCGEYNYALEFVRDMTGIALIRDQEDSDPIEGFGVVAERGLLVELEGQDANTALIPLGSLIWYGVHPYNYHRGHVGIYVGDQDGKKRVVSVVTDGVMEKDIDWVWFGSAILGYTTPEQLHRGWGERFREYYNDEDGHPYTFLWQGKV